MVSAINVFSSNSSSFSLRLSFLRGFISFHSGSCDLWVYHQQFCFLLSRLNAQLRFFYLNFTHLTVILTWIKFFYFVFIWFSILSTDSFVVRCFSFCSLIRPQFEVWSTEHFKLSNGSKFSQIPPFISNGFCHRFWHSLFFGFRSSLRSFQHYGFSVWIWPTD